MKIRLWKAVFRVFPCLPFILSFLLTPGASGHQTLSPPNKQESILTELVLLGVIVSANPSSSLAILKNGRTGQMIFLKSGENIGGLKLAHIYKNRITLQKEGKTFQLSLGGSSLIRSDSNSQKIPGKIKNPERLYNSDLSEEVKEIFITKELARSEVEERIKAEWSKIMKETRFTPNQVEGQIKGFRIIRLPGESILSEIGIQRNDIIQEINKLELNDSSNLFALYERFKDDNEIEVLIERGGKPIRIQYILKN